MCIKSELDKVGGRGRPLTQQKLQFAQIMINGLSAAPASQCKCRSAKSGKERPGPDTRQSQLSTAKREMHLVY